MLNKGYTLLEMMIVLFIFALLTGLIGPRLSTMYDSVQGAYQRDEIMSQLSSLSFQAYKKGLNFQFETYPFRPDNTDYLILQKHIVLNLPPDWTMVAPQPILFRANGACSGGTVRLTYQALEYKVQLMPPFCQATFSP